MKGGGRVEQMSLGMGIALHTNQVHPKHVSVHHLEYRLMREIQKYTHTQQQQKKTASFVIGMSPSFFFFFFFCCFICITFIFSCWLANQGSKRKTSPTNLRQGLI